MNLNGIEACLIGRLAGDVELKTSASGKSWTAFSVAVGDGDQVQWTRIVVFGDKAEQAAGFHKGDRVYCEGRIQLDTWTAKDGKERSGLKVLAWRIDRLAEIGERKPVKPKAPPEGEHPAPPAAGDRRESASAPRDWQAPFDDQIPFAPEVR